MLLSNIEQLKISPESAPQAILITDRDGQIAFANAEAARMFGYDRDDLLDLTLQTLLPGRAGMKYNQSIGQFLENSAQQPMQTHLNLNARRKDGAEFPVEIRLSHIALGGDRLITSYITDVTLQEEAEDEVQRLTARLEQRTRQLTALNEIGRTLAATLDLREIYCVMFHEIARGLLGSPHLTVALFDEEAQSIYCGFAIVDGEEIDAAELPPIPLGNGPQSDTIRTRQPQIVDLEQIRRELEGSGRYVQVGDERQPRSALYVPLVAGDVVVGVMHVQSYEVNAFRKADMPFLSILASQAAIAITNARLYAQEQERADVLERTLERQRELDSLKDEFIQNVSHELRTPLGITRGYAELLESGELGELKPEHKEPVSIIARRVRLLCKLVENFRTILENQTRESEPELVYLPDLIDSLLDDMRITAERAGLTLSAEVAPDVRPVSGNPTHLWQVFDNLLNNALKFTPEGGRIRVRLWEEGDDAVLEVADTGIGIPPDELERVFDRFYQVDGSMSRRHGGTGLGLALVQETVEAHGGRVGIESTVGAGSTFQVRLPLA